MAQKHTSGANTNRRVVVKIIGSKQVKQFIEEPREYFDYFLKDVYYLMIKMCVKFRAISNYDRCTQRDSGNSKKEENPPVEAICDDEKEKGDAVASRSDRPQQNLDSALWAVINQVPDRLCVTAPSGDRFRSYIHPKILHNSGPRAAEVLETTEQKGVCEDRGEAELSSAVREELTDWQLCSLRSAEDEVVALDLTCGGKLSRPEVTHLFLKHDVPLKLPTFSLLLQMFCDENDPSQIYYRNLLRFIRSSAFPEELHSDGQLQ